MKIVLLRTGMVEVSPKVAEELFRLGVADPVPELSRIDVREPEIDNRDPQPVRINRG